MNYSIAEKYASAIQSMTDEVIWDESGPNPALLMDQGASGRTLLKMFYAPFDYVNTEARIFIVGITPGRTQMINSISEFRNQLRAGAKLDDALRAAKVHGSFSGSMRPRLVQMLDHFRVNDYLGVRSCASLWKENAHLVQFCSGIRYPIFVGEKFANYTGQNPKPLTSAFLRRYLSYFSATTAEIPKALIIPLGAVMHETCRHLAQQGDIKIENLVIGIEHPSGGSNGNSGYLIDPKPKDTYAPKSSIPFDRIDLNRRSLIEAMDFYVARRLPAI